MTQKNRHLCTISQLCRAISSQLRQVSTIGKNVLNSNISSTRPHSMANFGPLTAEIGREFRAREQISSGFASWLCYRSDATHPRPTKLCTMFGRLLGWQTTYTLSALLPRERILPRAKFTLRPSLAFSYVGSLTIRHSISRHQPNFVAWYKEWNYGTFAEGATYIRRGGHHAWHRQSADILVCYSLC